MIKNNERKLALKLISSGMTQKDAAKKVKVTPKTVSKWVKQEQQNKNSLQNQIDDLKKELKKLRKLILNKDE